MTAHPPFRKVLGGVATREEMFSLFNRYRDDAGVDPLCGSIYGIGSRFLKVSIASCSR
ncbi:DUF1419 domain-containing protein [Mesorhizobium sp. M1328]|uniref:DUF1419 domain-containing protein n=1 Tax=Mesorhizobium sp. M1328 TaxID=2957082 RepID=UPI003336E03A